MIKWIGSLFEKRKTEKTSTVTARDDELLEQFMALLAERMEKIYPKVKAAFKTLLNANFPENINGLHIEVFLDDLPFSLRLYSKGNDDVWADEPRPVQEFNKTIDRIWPIVSEEELHQYKIWEDDPKWGRRMALEQPLDELDVPKIILPWLKKIMTEISGEFPHSVTASVHDLTWPEEL